MAVTTEHSALQAARSATVFETNGRMAQYLGTVSGALIALAFIGQVSQLGEAFYAFALTVLPSLIVLGLLTYRRCVDSAAEDLFYALAIARIHQYYQSLAPGGQHYLLVRGHDDEAGVLHDMGLVRTRWHLLSHASTMVLAVTSLIGGGAVALAASAAIGTPVPASAGLGAVWTTVSALLLYWHQHRHWSTATTSVAARLPLAPRRPGGDNSENQETL